MESSCKINEQNLERAKRQWVLYAGREKVLSSSNLSSLSFTMAALRSNLTVRRLKSKRYSAAYSPY